MFSWNVSQPAWHSLCIFVAVAYMIRFQTSRRTRHTLYLNPGEATKNERNVNHEHRQYYNILLFSTMRQPVGGVTVYLHAAPSEQYNLLFRRLSILWLYCGYKKKKKTFLQCRTETCFSPAQPLDFQIIHRWRSHTWKTWLLRRNECI